MRKQALKITLAGQQLGGWLNKYQSAELARQAQSLPLRQDMVTLLNFVRDNKVMGTPSTGNMPLKAVHEVTARFVEPPKLKATIGGQVYQIRSEAELWPLYFLHALADVGGLLKIAPARRWQLTSQGAKFLGAVPLLQTSFSLAVWWHQVNWLIAFPFNGMGEDLPPLFDQVTLAHLRSLPAATRLPFIRFADKLIGNAGLTWTAPDMSFAQESLRHSIERMVINILADFGAVKRQYRKKPLGRGTVQELASFQVTPLGKALLDAVALMRG